MRLVTFAFALMALIFITPTDNILCEDLSSSKKTYPLDTIGSQSGVWQRKVKALERLSKNTFSKDQKQEKKIETNNKPDGSEKKILPVYDYGDNENNYKKEPQKSNESKNTQQSEEQISSKEQTESSNQKQKSFDRLDNNNFEIGDADTKDTYEEPKKQTNKTQGQKEFDNLDTTNIGSVEKNTEQKNSMRKSRKIDLPSNNEEHEIKNLEAKYQETNNKNHYQGEEIELIDLEDESESFDLYEKGNAQFSFDPDLSFVVQENAILKRILEKNFKVIVKNKSIKVERDDIGGVWTSDIDTEKKFEQTVPVRSILSNEESSTNEWVYQNSKHLFSAIADNNMGAVDTILKKIKTTEVKNKMGDTPLLFATRLGRCAMVEFLLIHGAKKGARDAYGLTALDIAKKQKRVDIESIILNSV